MLEEDELKGARKVLTAAAMTYVAAVISTALQLLRLVLLSNSRRRD
jgi:Zn-dependent membrane protease YugP